MKHLFFIHSHTLFLTSLGVVDYLRLPQEDVLFVYSRNYKSVVPSNIQGVDVSQQIEDCFYIMLSWSRRNFLYRRKKREALVRFFDNFAYKYAAGSTFRLYVPHLQHHAFQIMATNPHCEEVFFVQEGGRTMIPLQTSKVSLLNRLYNRFVLFNDKRVWKCSNWFPNEGTPYAKPITAFAFDKNFFVDAPQKTIIIKWPRMSVDIDIDSQYPIFLLEGAVELGQVGRSVYSEAVKSIINEFAEKHNYIKFHPAQKAETRQIYLNMFKDKGCDVEELPMDVPFELVVVNYKNLKLYGFGTSLLFYGKSFGHHVVSRENLLMKSWRYRMYSKGLAKI